MISLLSPRMNELRVKLSNNRFDTVDDFWKTVEKEGAPLIEKIEEDPSNIIITFLYRGIEGNDKAENLYTSLGFQKVKLTRVYRKFMD